MLSRLTLQHYPQHYVACNDYVHRNTLADCRCETSRSADAIREALAAEQGQESVGPGNASAAAAAAHPAPPPEFSRASGPPGPTAPFPKIFTGGLSLGDLARPFVGTTGAQPPAVSIPLPRPFMAGAAERASAANSAAAESLNRIFHRCASASAEEPLNCNGTASSAPPPPPPTAAAPPQTSAFSKYPDFTDTSAPSEHAQPNMAAPLQPPCATAAPQCDPNAPAPPVAPTATASAAAFAGVRGGVLRTPSILTSAAAAPNPFGSPMPLRPPSAAHTSPGGPAGPNPFGAGPAPLPAMSTPVFQAPGAHPTAGATPPSTNGPSTAGSPFGMTEEAQEWFGMPAPGSGAARRRTGSVLRCGSPLANHSSVSTTIESHTHGSCQGIAASVLLCHCVLHTEGMASGGGSASAPCACHFAHRWACHQRLSALCAGATETTSTRLPRRRLQAPAPAIEPGTPPRFRSKASLVMHMSLSPDRRPAMTRPLTESTPGAPLTATNPPLAALLLLRGSPTLTQEQLLRHRRRRTRCTPRRCP